MKSAWASFRSPSNTLTAAVTENHRDAGRKNRTLRLRIESAGKVKAREQRLGVEERINSGNTVARDLEHDQRPRLASAGRVDPVLPKSRKPARTGLNQTRSPATATQTNHPASYRIRSLEPQGIWRHRKGRIPAQQRNQRIDVVALECRHVLVHHLLLNVREIGRLP